MGKSGSGKDFLARELCAFPSPYHRVVVTTTRPRREYEIDGVDYHFMAEVPFLFGQETFNDWHYGVRETDLNKNKINICVLSPKAIWNFIQEAKVFNLLIEYVIIRIKEDDKTRLMRQLSREEKPNVKEIIRRFSADAADFADLPFENYEIVDNSKNDNGISALRALRAILLKRP